MFQILELEDIYRKLTGKRMPETKNIEEKQEYCIKYIYDFLYNFLFSSSIFYNHTYEKMSNEIYSFLNKKGLLELVELFIIDLNYYFESISKYSKQNFKDMLNKDIEDYISLNKIPELNSKKYIISKLEHLSNLINEFGKEINIDLQCEVSLRKESNQYKVYIKSNISRNNYTLENIYKYITPNSSDLAIKEHLHFKLFNIIKKEIMEWIDNYTDSFSLIQEYENKIFSNPEDMKVFNILVKEFENFRNNFYSIFEKE